MAVASISFYQNTPVLSNLVAVTFSSPDYDSVPVSTPVFRPFSIAVFSRFIFVEIKCLFTILCG